MPYTVPPVMPKRAMPLAASGSARDFNSRSTPGAVRRTIFDFPFIGADVPPSLPNAAPLQCGECVHGPLVVFGNVEEERRDADDPRPVVHNHALLTQPAHHRRGIRAGDGEIGRA